MLKTFRRIAAAALAACALVAPAQAQNYTLKDAAGTTRTFCSYIVVTVQYPCPVIHGDNGGTPQAVQTDGSNRLKTSNTQSGTWNVGLAGSGVGAAGSPSPSVLSVQGVTSMTPFKVDGSAVTQPISGSLSNISGTISLPTGAATAALQGAQGTGSTYNPPTGGSGEIGYLSGIYAAATDLTTPSPVRLDQTSTNNNVVVASSALPTGASTSANQASVIGSKAAGTAATNSVLTGGVYNSTTPTLTNGQQAATQMDATGKTFVVAPTSDTKLDTLTTAVNAATPAGANVIGYTTSAFDVATTITRPANTTAYTAGDVLGGALDLGVLGLSAGSVEIKGVQLEADIAAIPASQTSWVLYLYSVTPPSATADNGAWDLPSGDRASYLGSIAIPAMADLGSTLYVESNGINKRVKLAGTHLFGYLVSVAGFTPAANSEVYKLTVHAVVQ